MSKKIVIFPNDSLQTYFDKGELTERYYNPMDIFQEVHVISLSDKEVSEDKVQVLAGAASLRIYALGKPGILNLINGSYQNRIDALVSKIRPDIIRAYNSNLAGWLAVKAARKMGIPSVISLHADPERDTRALINKLKEPKRWFIWNISKKVFEPYALSGVDRVICVYDFLLDYARGHAGSSKVKLIYNRIDTDRFDNSRKAPDDENRVPRILCVGRIMRQKNPENIVKAVKDLDIKLTLIGNGEYADRIERLIKGLGIENKVEFIKSVYYGQIHRFYKEADIFASSNNYGGVSKTVMEAMSSGLPIVASKPILVDSPDLVGDAALIVDNTPLGYKDAFQKLISDSRFRQDLGSRGRAKMLAIDGKKMEQQEKDLYQSLM